MRYAVRSSTSPYDKVGYLEAPAPEQLTRQDFKVAFPVVAVQNDHPDHWTAPKIGEQVLEVGLISHGADCGCRACKAGQRPADEVAIVDGGLPQETLRYLRGFHPVTVLDAKPATIIDDAPVPNRAH